MFDVFFTHVLEKVTLNEEEKETLKSFFVSRKLRKKQYLLEQGEVCKHMSFVEKGLLRSYNVDEKGEEHMIQFAWEGWWICDTYSFLSGEKAAFNIDAIEVTELLMISAVDFERLTLQVPKMERYFRILFQNNIVTKERRLMSSITHTAEEKYIQLVESNPQIILRIPQNLIASYLGFTPETLSRIKKNLATRR
jgi:CRP-like cAMP-binding protein